MRKSAELHILTGKGGVGKSTVSASLALHLANKNEGPVLLIDVQGSGRALKLLGLERLSFANISLPMTRKAWGSRILPRETFQQYFELLLALGNEQSPFAQLTSGIRGRVVEKIFENKIVSAFVDVCPGLEPAVLLGKLHWEASEGSTPETNEPWRHVVVDAPSTGHAVMLFKSCFAMIEIFGGGTIFKQARRIRDYVLDRSLTHVTVVTTPEELPIQETLEMKSKLDELKLCPVRYIINRSPPATQENGQIPLNIDTSWASEISIQKEIWSDQKTLISEFKKRINKAAPVYEFPEIPDASNFAGVQKLASRWSGTQL